MIKKTAHATLEINYCARDEEVVPAYTEEEAAEDFGEGLGPDESLGTYFTLFVKDKKGSGLVFDCNTVERQLTVYRVRKLEEYLRGRKSEKLDSMCPVYMGPCFLNLGDKLQNSFLELLESLGVTEEVLGYIERSAFEKEQKLYIKWMEDVNSALKNIC